MKKLNLEVAGMTCESRANAVLAALGTWVLFGPGREIISMALAGVRRRISNQHDLLFTGEPAPGRKRGATR